MEKNVPLKNHTTLHLGGAAAFFARAGTVDELKEALRFAEEKKLPVLVLGGGSNVLASDKGFAGLAIKIEIPGIVFEEAGDLVRVTAGAGELWDAFVAKTVEHGLYGLENLSGIPGSVGGAPVQNIGAYGAEVRQVIESVEALDAHTLRQVTFSNQECRFGYRDSFFKTEEGRKYVIISVTFVLSKKGKVNISYKDLQNYFALRKPEEVTLRDVRTAVLQIRKGKFPDLTEVGTAGSFFKNPIVSNEKFEELKKKYPGLPGFPVDAERSTLNDVKIPLAWILDNVLGRKGERIGNVGLYEKQPLVLVHFGGGTAEEVKELAKKIADEVKEKTGITIEPEVAFVG